MYSYAGGRIEDGQWHPRPYTPADTFQPIAVSIQRLDQLLNGIILQHPGSQFILIGHSLGGRVAFDYLASADSAVLDRVRGLLTLDAPLLGMGYQALGPSSMARRFLPGHTRTSLEQLLVSPHELRQREAQVVETLDRLTGEGISVYTLASQSDLVVPLRWAVAMLPDGRPAPQAVIIDAGRSWGTWLQCTGHVQILNHPATQEVLFGILGIR